jgi:uncharacterized protein YndB with AHSA1/START domain
MMRKFSFQKAAKKHLGDGGAQDVYAVEFTCQTQKSLDEVWAALVKPDKIAQWMGPVSGKLAKGGAFQLGDRAEGRITQCEPKRRLAFDLMRGPSRQGVEITFGEDGKGKSKQRVIAVKITAHVQDLPAGTWDRLGPAALGMGWELLAQALLDYLAGGASAPPRKGGTTAFAASAEGRAFCSAAFEGWRAAALAGGAGSAIMAGPAPSVLEVYTGLHP